MGGPRFSRCGLAGQGILVRNRSYDRVLGRTGLRGSRVDGTARFGHFVREGFLSGGSVYVGGAEADFPLGRDCRSAWAAQRRGGRRVVGRAALRCLVGGVAGWIGVCRLVGLRVLGGWFGGCAGEGLACLVQRWAPMVSIRTRFSRCGLAGQGVLVRNRSTRGFGRMGCGGALSVERRVAVPSSGEGFYSAVGRLSAARRRISPRVGIAVRLGPDGRFSPVAGVVAAGLAGRRSGASSGRCRLGWGSPVGWFGGCTWEGMACLVQRRVTMVSIRCFPRRPGRGGFAGDAGVRSGWFVGGPMVVGVRRRFGFAGGGWVMVAIRRWLGREARGLRTRSLAVRRAGGFLCSGRCGDDR